VSESGDDLATDRNADLAFQSENDDLVFGCGLSMQEVFAAVADGGWAGGWEWSRDPQEF